MRVAPVRSWATAVFTGIFSTVSSIIIVTVCPSLRSSSGTRAVERVLAADELRRDDRGPARHERELLAQIPQQLLGRLEQHRAAARRPHDNDAAARRRDGHAYAPVDVPGRPRFLRRCDVVSVEPAAPNVADMSTECSRPSGSRPRDSSKDDARRRRGVAATGFGSRPARAHCAQSYCLSLLEGSERARPARAFSRPSADAFDTAAKTAARGCHGCGFRGEPPSNAGPAERGRRRPATRGELYRASDVPRSPRPTAAAPWAIWTASL